MLTKVTLDPCHQSYFRDAGSRYEMHRTVQKVCGAGRSLWRLERPLVGELPVLYVRSEEAQAWEPLISDGYVIGIERQEVSELKEGMVAQYQIECSPSVKRSTSVKRQGRRRFHKDPVDQVDWLRRTGSRCGFAVESSNASAYTRSCFYRKGKRIILYTVDLQGILNVIEPTLLKQALTNGLGAGKAYGAGLLLVTVKQFEL